MNLMFWKKKTGAVEETENTRKNLAVNTKPRESLDFVAAKQDIAERGPESSDTEATSPETQAKPGLAARIKLRLSALNRHFKKAPAFRADEDHAPDAPGDSRKPVNAAAIEPDPEPPDMATPAKPGLAARIKLRFIALARRFRKTPAPDADEDHAGETNEPSAPEMPAKPGLLTRINAGFAAFSREFKTPAAPAASEDREADSHGRSEAAPEYEHSEDVSDTGSARSRKWLVIGGATGLLVLLLVGIGIAIWPAFTPSQKRWGTRHDITTITSRTSQPESAPEETQTEVEALKRENAELQARIEALKKEPQQQRPYVPPVRQSGGIAPSSSVNGELMVGTKDPNAAAMSLKEAIEAMNAGTGDYNKKPAK